MNQVTAAIGMVANFGPLTMDDLRAITGWCKQTAYRATLAAREQGELSWELRYGTRFLRLARPRRYYKELL